MKNGRYVLKAGELLGLEGIHADLDVIAYFKDDEFHREDGPAIDCAVMKVWVKNHQPHREDGPAVEVSDGTKEWFINGIEFTEEEFNHWLIKKALNDKLQELPHKPAAKKGKI